MAEETKSNKFTWITATILMILLGGTTVYLTPTDGYDVCRSGATYGTWSNTTETVYVNEELRAVGRYHCDIEDIYRYCGRTTKTRCYKVLEEANMADKFLEPIVTNREGKYKEYHNVLEPAKTKLKDFIVKDIIPNKTGLDFSQFESMNDIEFNKELIRRGTYLKHDHQLEELKVMYPDKIQRFNQLIEQAQYQEEKDELIIERDRLIDKYEIVLLEEEVRIGDLFYRNPVGTTYYIDCNAGNDSHAGTSTGTAWETINKYTTTTIRTAGDIGIIRAGTKCNQTADIAFDEDGTEDNYLHLIGADSINDPWSDSSDIKPIIDFLGGNYNMIASYDNYWRFYNLNIINSTDYSSLLYMRGVGTVIDNCIFNNSGNPRQVINFQDYYGLIKNSKIIGDLSSNYAALAINTGGSLNSKNNFYLGKYCVGPSASFIYSYNDTFNCSSTLMISFSGGKGIFDKFVLKNTPPYLCSNLDSSSMGYCQYNDYNNGSTLKYSMINGGILEKENSIVRTGGSSSSLKMTTTSNSRKNASYIDRNIFPYDKLGDFKMWNDDTSEITISMWARAFGWATLPDNSTFFLRATYLNESSLPNRIHINSTQEFSANDVWQEFNVTFTPARSGWIYLDFIVKDSNINDGFYFDIKPVVS